MEIIHDAENGRFYTIIDEMESGIHYWYEGDDRSVINVYRTFVPEALRGRHIAEHLVGAVIDFAKSNSLHIHPTCSYVVSYFRRHKEHASLLSDNTDPENGGSCRIR